MRSLRRETIGALRLERKCDGNQAHVCYVTVTQKPLHCTLSGPFQNPLAAISTASRCQFPFGFQIRQSHIFIRRNYVRITSGRLFSQCRCIASNPRRRYSKFGYAVERFTLYWRCECIHRRSRPNHAERVHYHQCQCGYGADFRHRNGDRSKRNSASDSDDAGYGNGNSSTAATSSASRFIRTRLWNAVPDTRLRRNDYDNHHGFVI